MDVTTNWAIVVTGASVSIAFSQPNVHHGVIMLNAMLITLFLFIEARRYRYYEMGISRVRMMETDFFAAMLVPPFHPSPQWAENLADNVQHPKLPVSMWEALGLRLRRNYLWIFLIIILAWIAKYWLFPVPATDLQGFISRAAIGPVSGTIVVSLSLAYFAFLTLVAIFTLGLTHTTGSREPLPGPHARPRLPAKPARRPWTTRGARGWLGLRQPSQLVALIITNQPDAIAKQILSESKRGITAVPGEESTMLICALRATEIKFLRTVVAQEDPHASINIISAQEILGGDFDPLSGE
jgi:uncharacterized membrane protein